MKFIKKSCISHSGTDQLHKNAAYTAEKQVSKKTLQSIPRKFHNLSFILSKQSITASNSEQ